jgi:hypothetical protein
MHELDLPSPNQPPQRDRILDGSRRDCGGPRGSRELATDHSQRAYEHLDPRAFQRRAELANRRQHDDRDVPATVEPRRDQLELAVRPVAAARGVQKQYVPSAQSSTGSAVTGASGNSSG